ncbi:pseudouridine synthase [Pseudomassariella vexata]|uniref:Pseudouridine synthase n=1 Tax=Pseudomassariella vexata TaxID=1141098 RepID=A0A1Y2EDC8_9PEZI|nr:pseudouridine synthase [Pseudomassariella vexata]ORY69562.1 pseudouridine synthase [Pseudomassariella vexata]
MAMRPLCPFSRKALTCYRYTDFQVNEIAKDGEVVRLRDFVSNAREYRKETKSSPAQSDASKPLTEAAAALASEPAKINATGPKAEAKDEPKEAKLPAGQIAPSDASILVELLGQTAADEMIALYARIVEDPKAKIQGSVKLSTVADRAARTRVHTEVRRIFSGKIDTSTGSDGIIQAAAASRSTQRWGERRQTQQNTRRDGPSGKYLHFSLYKENRDTMDTVGQIARALNMKPNMFGIAGTKDRRAVTVQRVSMRSKDPASLVFINSDRRFNGVKIGDFKFEETDLWLGCHNGNEFAIVMKDCMFSGTEHEPFERQLEIAQSTVDAALAAINRSGFINYFGTQRFGTFEIGTQDIGTKILKEDFEGAIQDLLAYDPVMVNMDTTSSKPGEYVRYDDINRAKALAKFKETGDAQGACKMLPRRCNTEFNILRHLANRPTDFMGALQAVTRSMRNMYLHAYQSLVWNFAASKRWETHGLQVVKGDLVLSTMENGAGKQDDPDEVDEETLHLAGGDADEAGARQNVRILSAEDAASGRYSIYDVVLPTPGYDVIYPNNEIGQFYIEFMGREENGSLNPHDMRRRQKDFSLSGTYRKFMGNFIKPPTASVRSYINDNDQLIPTDLDLIIKSRKTTRDASDGPEIPLEDRRKRVKIATPSDEQIEKPVVEENFQPEDKHEQQDQVMEEVKPQDQDNEAQQEQQAPPPAPVVEENKIAVIFRFQLHTSQYATIALRELQGYST